MADIILSNEYIVVRQTATGEIMVSDFFTSARVETMQTIEQGETVGDISPTGLPDLPDSGWIELNKLYNYQGVTVHCIQAHNRTIYTPDETPALFAVYRENTDTLEWVPNEGVKIGWIRIYNGIPYECIQAHMTLEGWTPDVTPALWQEDTGDEVLVWVQPAGAHDAYNIGDQVYFPTVNDSIYESVINANVWSPTAYPAGWRIV